MPIPSTKMFQMSPTSNEYPQRRISSLIEEEAYYEDEYIDAYANDFNPNELDIQNRPIQNKDNGGTSCVHVIKIIAHTKIANRTQINSIFKTRCNINKKECNVIIDSMSSANVWICQLNFILNLIKLVGLRRVLKPR